MANSIYVNKRRRHRSLPVKTGIQRAVQYACLVLLALFFLFPFYVILSRAFMSNEDVMAWPAKIIFSSPSAEAFQYVFSKEMIGWLLNTLLIMGINIVFTPFSASLVAYAFAKLKFRMREFWFAVMLCTIMLPGIVIQIPSYIIFNALNWINTPMPLIINSFLGGGAVIIFLFRQYMRTIPQEFSEAARIDGMNVFMIYLKIVLPLCMPIVLFCMVTTFLSVWNDFMGPLIYLKDYRSYTLALGIFYRFSGEINNLNRENVQMATGLLMLLPCMAIFFMFQDKLISGIAIGGIKG